MVVTKIVESEGYKNDVIDPTRVDKSSQKNVERFKQYMQDVTPDQEMKVYTLCEELAEKYKLEWFMNTLNNKTLEDTERSEYVSNDSQKNVEEVKNFRTNVYEKYPDVDEPYKTAYENAIYAFANNSEEELKKTLDQNIDKSDQNIDKSEKNTEA